VVAVGFDVVAQNLAAPAAFVMHSRFEVRLLLFLALARQEKLTSAAFLAVPSPQSPLISQRCLQVLHHQMDFLYLPEPGLEHSWVLPLDYVAAARALASLLNFQDLVRQNLVQVPFHGIA
jgi:hypothetical protein